MKKFIIDKCMNYIQKHYQYSDIKLAEIKYGLESIYLTISKLIVITILAILLGIIKEMIIYMIIYNIIRTTSYGLHATKSWICLLTSTILFIGIPYLAIYLNIPLYFKYIIGLLCIMLIFKNSPADTYKRPIVSKKRRIKLKLLSTIISIMYCILAIIISNNFLSNCFILSLVMQNGMISPTIYKIFKLPYNNYKNYILKHPELNFD